LLSGCVTNQTTASTADEPVPSNYKQQILSRKLDLWKDADSIKDAQIGTPHPNMMGWQVCVAANAKNSFGGYTGKQTFIAQIYRNGAPVILLEPTIYDSCGSMSDFPELDGGYVAPSGAQANASLPPGCKTYRRYDGAIVRAGC
jgi:hypothetical protein